MAEKASETVKSKSEKTLDKAASGPAQTPQPAGNTTVAIEKHDSSSTTATDDVKKATMSQDKYGTKATITVTTTTARSTLSGTGEETGSRDPSSHKTVTLPASTSENKKAAYPTIAESKSPSNTGNDRVTVDKPNDPLVPRTVPSKVGESVDPEETSSSKRNDKGTNQKIESSTMTQISSAPPPKRPPAAPPKATGGTGKVTAPPTSQSSTRTTIPKMATASIPQPADPATLTSLRAPGAGISSIQTGSSNAVLTEEQVRAEEELLRQRAPLSDKYAPYIIGSDTSLEDARRRLRIALDQTRQLRAAFTERVYGKYRVCLKPPPQTEDILQTLKENPKLMYKKLQTEMRRTKSEKEIEKKETQKINSEIAAGANSGGSGGGAASAHSSSAEKTPNNPLAALNADNAEQLMYVTAGLSLIVLPESDVSNTDMSMYNERGPMNPKTGQRARGISAAAAAAGEVMLERARRGQVMRAEREKRRQLQQNSGGEGPPDDHFDKNYYRGPIFKPTIIPATSTSVAPSAVRKPAEAPLPKSSQKNVVLSSETQMKAIARGPGKGSSSKRPPSATPAKPPGHQSAAGAKAIRARVQATTSLNTLLSLNPTHEELRTDSKYSAATLAMMELGVGTQLAQSAQQNKNAPHRFKHPFPDSLGGRRRAASSTNSCEDLSQALSLPPLPTIKDRRRHKNMAVISPETAASSRATTSIRRILSEFHQPSTGDSDPGFGPRKKRKRVTEIGLMRGLSLSSQEETLDNDAIDSSLALNVLKAVGFIAPCTADHAEGGSHHQLKLAPLFNEAEMQSVGVQIENGPYGQSIARLKELESNFSAKRSFAEAFCTPKASSSTKTQELKQETKGMNNPAPSPVALRGGGGETKPNTKEDKKSGKQSTQTSESEVGRSVGHEAPTGAVAASSRSAASAQNQGMQNQNMNPTGYQNVVWDERTQQPMVLLQSPLMANGGLSQVHNGQLQTQLHPAEHYHQTNALQLAHQLRMSRLQTHGHPAAGDLAEYIGGLHQQQAQAAYDWSAVGAAVGASHSLAALGLNQHRAAMVPLSVQDRTRVLLAREHQTLAAHAAAAQRQQQAVAMLGGAGGANPYAAPGYPHLAGQLLNPSAAALIGHAGIQRLPLPGGAQNQTGGLQSQGPHHLMQNLAPKQELTASSSDKKTDQETKNDTTSSKVEKKSGESQIHDSAKEAPPTPERTSKRKSPGEAQKAAEFPLEKRQRLSSKDGENKPEAKVPSLSNETMPPAKLEKQSCSDLLGGDVKKSVNDRRLSNETPAGNPQDSSIGKSEETKETRSIGDANTEDKLKAPVGLQYFVPATPDGISSDVATKVLGGRCHEAINTSIHDDQLSEGALLVDYIVSVGTAVPIPKTMVMHRLKDRMNHAAFKNSCAGNIPASSRDVIAAVILLWLWRNKEEHFQRAFAKSGRIDVDSECKWFVDAAVNKAMAALSDHAGAESPSRKNSALIAAILSHKSKSSASHKGVQGIDQDSIKASTTKIDLLASYAVSSSLNMSFALVDEMDSLLPTFHEHVEYLDEARKCALYSKSQERALLAAIVSRKSTMSFSFSHAYVSAMVRAGEALGHGALFEAVQNEKFGVSTMIPYDVFTDESYAWEDPCRPAIGFTEGLTGDEMMRRAHARAMIQKSLKKLQDRHNIKGGTSLPGPYVDQSNATASVVASKLNSGTPRGGLQKRRSSFSDPPIQPGTGSAAATSWSLYDPKHTCQPLEWNSDDLDNTPYGRHDMNTRPRSLSLAQGAAVLRQSGRGGKGLRRQQSSRSSFGQDEQPILSKDEKEESGGIRRSTREIPWEDIAGIFQRVQLPGTVKEKKESETKKLSLKERTIFAPVVQELSSIPVLDDNESEEEEDLTDDTVLARHQVVLDEMKAKLAAIFDSRKKSQDRRKSRDKSSKS